VVAGLTSCGGAAPLRAALESPDAVARAVLAAIEHGDREALRSLAVDEAEFRAHVWPALPAARPERNLPFSFVWGDLHQKSEASLSTTLARYKGRRFEFVGVRFAQGSTRYASYDVHRESVLQVRAADGQPAELRVLGSMLVKDGRWKVFSYVVD
jgi:hypothetical protein